MAPTLKNGKICYVEIPAVDIQRSAEFYRRVFGWRIRQRGDGATAFDDATGEVSGTWVLGRPAAGSTGLLIYIMVDDAAAAAAAVTAHGGEIVQPVGADAPEITARFRDPAGNIVGIYQEPAHAQAGAEIQGKPTSSTSRTGLRRALSDIHRYWFGELKGADDFPKDKADIWFRQSDETDRHIRDTYGPHIKPAASLDWDLQALTPAERIGLIVLLDQFPRNIFRTTGEAFAYDAAARSMANRLIAAGDSGYHPLERVFLYLPLEHSESALDQDRAVELFDKLCADLGETAHPFYKSAAEFAEKHRVLIRRFGRFPHRNAVLGRDSTAEEAAFLKEHGRGY